MYHNMYQFLPRIAMHAHEQASAYEAEIARSEVQGQPGLHKILPISITFDSKSSVFIRSPDNFSLVNFMHI